jgi:transposase-like protein
MNKPITDELKVEQTHPETYQTLEEVVRAGAKKMLIVALEAEVEAYIQVHQGERDKKGHALVVRNGHSQERTIQCGAGTLQVKAPRVHDQRPSHHFSSKILPPYLRRSPRLETAVPVLYLRGLSTGDFQPALSALLGEEAVAGFSASTITRLLTIWQEEYRGWRKRSLAGKQYI